MKNNKPLHPSLVSLSPEELAKIPKLTTEEIDEALRKGKEEADAWRKASYGGVSRYPGIRYI